MKEQLLRLGRGTAIYGVGQIVNRALSFFLLPLFTSYLTPEDYGVIGILMMVSLLLTPLISLGFGTSIGVSYFDGSSRERKDKTIWTSFSILLLSTGILAALAFVFDRQISFLAFRTDRYSFLVLMSVLTTCLSVLVSPFMFYLQFEEMAKRFIALTVTSSIVTIGINLVMVVGFRLGVTGMVEGNLIGQAITFLLIAYYPALKTRAGFDRDIARDLLRHGLPMVPSFASLFILQQGNRYALQWFRGLNEVGIFTVGYNFGMFMNLMVNAFVSAWVPFFLSFSDKREEAKSLFGRIMTYYLLGFGTMSLLFFVLAKPAVEIMTTPAFHPAYKVVGFVAGSQFLIGISSILQAPIFFAKEVRFLSVLQAVVGIISVGIYVVGTSYMGAFGAAAGMFACYLLLVVGQYVWNMSRRDYFREEFEWDRIVKFMLMYFVAAFIFISIDIRDLYAAVGFSAVGSAMLIALAYSMLTIHEKNFVKNLLFGRT